MPAGKSPILGPDQPTRDEITRVLKRSAMTGVGLLALYAVLPPAGHSDVTATLVLLAGLVVFLVLIGRQIRTIVIADHPRLRAIEALALILPVLLLVFSYTYVSLSEASPGSFTEPLDRVDGLYFSTTVLGTVGFGDIAAKTSTARLLVTVQILIGLGSAVGLARLLLGAANVGVSRRSQREQSGSE